VLGWFAVALRPRTRKLSVRRAARIQESLRPHIILRAPRALRAPRLVAGADVSYDPYSDTIWSAVVVFGFPGMEILDRAGAQGRATFPYIPGYLSFREIPILVKALERIRRVPDLILCDGQGIAHPRGFGLASHLGLLLGIPTIGCAKSRLVGEHGPVGRSRGAASALMYGGRRVGTVLRTREGVNPIYVSPGHLIDATTATRLALRCCRGRRLPEPTRQAHIEVNRLRLIARAQGDRGLANKGSTPAGGLAAAW